MTISVVIPHIPTRREELQRAVASVTWQNLQPEDVIIVTDRERLGSGPTRTRGVQLCRTDWIAFLDDDDEFDSNHLETLHAVALRENVDVVYSGCRVVDPAGRRVPLREEWGRFGEPFNAELLRRQSYIPVTSLVRAERARWSFFGAPDGGTYDDWGFYLRLLELGARFHHVPEVTWTWHHHGRNTSGRADRW